jgi:hypothetical protein
MDQDMIAHEVIQYKKKLEKKNIERTEKLKTP